MSVFCTKWFKKWSKKSNLKDQDLIEAVANMEAGLSCSDLGNDLLALNKNKLTYFVDEKILFNIEVSK